MTPCQVKLSAIRTRLAGAQSPALDHFVGGRHPSIRVAILSILDGDVSIADAAWIEQQMDDLADA